MTAAPIAYQGDPSLEAPILDALREVIDPEMAINIVDLGLVYGIRADERRVHVDLTMTSAACPVAEVIADDIDAQLRQSLGDDVAVDVALVWDPPWSPERMHAIARRLMGW